MLNEDELRDVVLLVFANRKSITNSMNVVEIANNIGLHSLRQYH